MRAVGPRSGMAAGAGRSPRLVARGSPHQKTPELLSKVPQAVKVSVARSAVRLLQSSQVWVFRQYSWTRLAWLLRWHPPLQFPLSRP